MASGTGKGKKGGPLVPVVFPLAGKGRLTNSNKELINEKETSLVSMFKAEEEWEDAKRDFLSRLSSLNSADINHVPWDQAQLFVSIKMNRVSIVEFEKEAQQLS